MSKKTLFSSWTWREYTLQLSVVIVGIMVTFIGSDLIGRWSRQRQVKTVMQFVAEELKTNRTGLVEVCQKLRHDRGGMLMFEQYNMDIERVPADSLEYYMFILGEIQGLALQTDALEVLKMSGVIPSIADKHLLMQTLGCYRSLNSFQVNVEFYNQRKKDALNHLFANKPLSRINSDDPREAWAVMMEDPMCASFLGTAAYSFGDDVFLDEIISSIDETIVTINDKYGFE